MRPDMVHIFLRDHVLHVFTKRLYLYLLKTCIEVSASTKRISPAIRLVVSVVLRYYALASPEGPVSRGHHEEAQRPILYARPPLAHSAHATPILPSILRPLLQSLLQAVLHPFLSPFSVLSQSFPRAMFSNSFSNSFCTPPVSVFAEDTRNWNTIGVAVKLAVGSASGSPFSPPLRPPSRSPSCRRFGSRWLHVSFLPSLAPAARVMCKD
jgi:hypothetical protein